MKAIRLGCHFLLGVLIALLVLEAALRFLPVSRGLFRTLEVERWPLQGYTPHAQYAYSMSWDFLNYQRGQTNNYGHLAPFDFVKGSRPVLVLGDSFIEAQMLRYQDTLQGQLGRLAGPVPVYGFGYSGNSIAEQLATVTMAKDEFHPRAMVVLMIDGDISESIGARPNHHFFEFKDRLPVLGYRTNKGVSLSRRIREPLGDSALYRYVFGNLKFSPADLVAAMLSTPVAADTNTNEKYDEHERKVADFFLREFSARSGVPAHCIVFLIDGDRYELYDPKYKPIPTKDSAALTQYFSARAAQLGYRVIDLKLQFLAHYQQHGQKFDFWPVDRHWNWLGHKIAAQAAFQSLSASSACL